MKANEAPEKLYFGERDKGILDIYSNKESNDEVEYIRTDAFIEKAKKWFEKQNEWRDINGIKHCDMESFEDFVKFMEGD